MVRWKVYSMYVSFFKRFIDIIIAFFAIIILSPFILTISAIVKLTDPGPIFFKQNRIGKNKKTFTIYKFRTMKSSTPHDTPTHLLENPEQYITKIGGFLRKTSLDELPQLFNILEGDMSIIGPRPALWNQEDLIAERDKYGVNSICPGLTGWAQINGRDELSIEEKVNFDNEYLQNLSFSFDIKCFFKTVFSVLRSDGIVEGANAQNEEKEKILNES